MNGYPLPAPKRREVVADLASAGMSNRAIAEVVGAGETTVRRDLAGAPNGAPDLDRKVMGQDGKTYQRKPDVVAELKRQIEDAVRQLDGQIVDLFEIVLEANSPEALAQVQGFLDETMLKAGFGTIPIRTERLSYAVPPSVQITLVHPPE